ncbi:MAG: ParB/RepB/Spo0J family partition protein [Campylobacterota bacterium]|nr:ParB/RepB/Spo0J family partition protein [Campylobacterota bacterium]
MALGKGLGAILEEVGQTYEQDMVGDHHLTPDKQSVHVEDLDIKLISPNPYQPRKHFDEQALIELSESIKNHGLLQPIVVMAKEDGYLLIAGERRLRAHKLAKLKTIKAIIADVDIDTAKLRELALIENIQRENLNAIELANSYAELIDVHSITHEELSSIVHKSRSQITNTMRLLTLSPYLQKKLLKGKLSQGHAKILVGLSADLQKVAVDTIIGQKLSVREAENLVRQYKTGREKPEKIKQKSNTWITSFQGELKKVLPFKHKLRSNKLEISFENEAELQKFMEIIKKA